MDSERLEGERAVDWFQDFSGGKGKDQDEAFAVLFYCCQFDEFSQTLIENSTFALEEEEVK